MWSEITFTTYGPTYWGLFSAINKNSSELIVLLSHYFCSWRNSRPVLSATASKLLTFCDHLAICGLPRICFTAENKWQSFSNEPPPGIIISVDSPVTRLHSTYNGFLTDPRIQSNTAQRSQGSNVLPVNHKRKLYEIISILYIIYIYIYIYTHTHTHTHTYISAFSIK